MILIYPFLVALLLRIAATQANPFTAIDAIVINKPFTISWDPTTEGTVTLTLIAVDSDSIYFQDLLVLGANLPNSGSFTGTIGGTPPSTSCGIKIVSDEDPTLVTYSGVFDITEDTSEDTTPDTPTTLETVTVHTTVAETTTYIIPPADPRTSQSAISSSTTATAAASADITPASSSLPSESSTPSSTGGLSAGAAAGIGVGTTLGALLLLSIGGFFWWRGRKRVFRPETETSAGAGAGAGALETEESKSKKRASELEGAWKMPVELQGTPRAELG